MSTKLEMIDSLRERTNVTYEEAKEALDICKDDMVEALVYLERNNKIKPESEKKNGCCHSFANAIKNIIKKGNKTKFEIKKKENTLIKIPVTLAVIITIIAPHLTVVGLIAALILGFRIQFVKEDGSDMEVNKVLNKVSDVVDDTKNKLITQ